MDGGKPNAARVNSDTGPDASLWHDVPGDACPELPLSAGQLNGLKSRIKYASTPPTKFASESPYVSTLDSTKSQAKFSSEHSYLECSARNEAGQKEYPTASDPLWEMLQEFQKPIHEEKHGSVRGPPRFRKKSKGRKDPSKYRSDPGPRSLGPGPDDAAMWFDVPKDAKPAKPVRPENCVMASNSSRSSLPFTTASNSSREKKAEEICSSSQKNYGRNSKSLPRVSEVNKLLEALQECRVHSPQGKSSKSSTNTALYASDPRKTSKDRSKFATGPLADRPVPGTLQDRVEVADRDNQRAGPHPHLEVLEDACFLGSVASKMRYPLSCAKNTCGSDLSCTVLIRGVGIHPHTCTFVRKGEQGESVNICLPVGDAARCSDVPNLHRVFINGHRLGDVPKTLRHGDRIVLGYRLCFRIIFPEQKTANNWWTAEDSLREIAQVVALNTGVENPSQMMNTFLIKYALLSMDISEGNAINSSLSPTAECTLRYEIAVSSLEMVSTQTCAMPELGVRLFHRQMAKRGPQEEEVQYLGPEEFRELLGGFRKAYIHWCRNGQL